MSYIEFFAYRPYVAPCNFAPSFSSCFVRVTVPVFLLFCISITLSFSFLLKYVVCVVGSYPDGAFVSFIVYNFPHSNSLATRAPFTSVFFVASTFWSVSIMSNVTPCNGIFCLLLFTYSSILFIVILPFALSFFILKFIVGIPFFIISSPCAITSPCLVTV